MKIISHKERQDDEQGFSITKVGGLNDGQEFSMVKATLDDGSVRQLWICNTTKGYFKQVFVPWDLEHTLFIE